MATKEIKVTQHECERCGYIWQARVDKPKQCPACKSRSWDKPKENK